VDARFGRHSRRKLEHESTIDLIKVEREPGRDRRRFGRPSFSDKTRIQASEVPHADGNQNLQRGNPPVAGRSNVADPVNSQSTAPAPLSTEFDSSAPAGPEQEFAERGPDLYDYVFHLVNELAALADPEARDLIRTAFDEGMVETFFINEQFVERQYQRGGEPARECPDWLERYREEYREHHTVRPSPSPKPLALQAP
jgi:hypothetical protein